MKNFLLMFLSIALVSCNNTMSANQNVSPKNADSSKINLEKVSSKGNNTEYMDWKAVKINGKLPWITTTNALYKSLGKPDSIVVPNLNDYCGSFYNKPFKLAYIKGTSIEVYGDTAVVTSINFKYNPEVELKTKTLTLNRSIILSQLEKMFPNAVKAQFKLNDLQAGETVAINLAISKEHLDDSWLLLFKNGKLVRIDYYTPC